MLEISSRISKNSFICFNGKDFCTDCCEKKYSDSLSFGINLVKIFELCYEPFAFENDMLESYLRSFRECRINPEHFQLYNLIDEDSFLKITRDKLEKMFPLLIKLSKKKEFEKACRYYVKFGRQQYKLLNIIEKNGIPLSDGRKIRLKYNDTRTGRLSCDGPINIFALRPDRRQSIVSEEGHSLLKLDYSACQVRLFFYMTKNELYKVEDPYLEISKEIQCSRETAKDLSIKMLFGAYKNTFLKSISERQYEKLESIFDKQKIKTDSDFAYDEFERPIKILTDNKSTIINNILQSMERNVLLSSLCKINDYIKTNEIQAKILFPFHDAVVIMIRDEHLIGKTQEIKEIFENSFFGCKMFSKVKKGKDFKEVS